MATEHKHQYNLAYRLWRAGKGPHPRELLTLLQRGGDQRPYMTGKPLPRFFLCPECAYRCLRGEMTCGRCMRPIKMELVVERESKQKTIRQEVRSDDRYLFADRGTIDELNFKLDAYLARKKLTERR
jgi:hypothetical protein